MRVFTQDSFSEIVSKGFREPTEGVWLLKVDTDFYLEYRGSGRMVGFAGDYLVYYPKEHRVAYRPKIVVEGNKDERSAT